MTDQILIHHGVKGMKWGVRRYRNKDGSLTAEGKARAQRQEERDVTRAKRQDYKQASKNRRNLSDEELLARIGRLEMEKKLKDLTDENLRNKSKYQSATQEVLVDSGKKIAKTVLVGGVMYLGKAYLTGQMDRYGITTDFDPTQAASYIFSNPNKKK